MYPSGVSRKQIDVGQPQPQPRSNITLKGGKIMQQMIMQYYNKTLAFCLFSFVCFRNFMKNLIAEFILVAFVTADVNKYIYRDIHKGIKRLEKDDGRYSNSHAISILIYALQAGLRVDWSQLIPEVETALTSIPEHFHSFSDSYAYFSTLPAHYHIRYHITSHMINSLVQAGLEDDRAMEKLAGKITNIMKQINKRRLSNESRRAIKSIYDHVLSVALAAALSEFTSKNDFPFEDRKDLEGLVDTQHYFSFILIKGHNEVSISSEPSVVKDLLASLLLELTLVNFEKLIDDIIGKTTPEEQSKMKYLLDLIHSIPGTTEDYYFLNLIIEERFQKAIQVIEDVISIAQAGTKSITLLNYYLSQVLHILVKPREIDFAGSAQKLTAILETWTSKTKLELLLN